MKKQRKIPIFITKLSKLVRRIPPTHLRKHEFQEQLRNHSSGFKGEQSLEYFYRYLPKDVQFLHGLRILDDDYFFQMDTILITPSFITILEIKYMAGHLFFEDQFYQFIRTHNGKEEAFANPIDQVHRQRYHLSKILNQNKIASVPIETLVVMTHPSAIIESTPTYKEAAETIIKSSSLKQKFESLAKKHPTPILTEKEVKKIVKLLSKLSSSYDPDICELFQVQKNELLRGVFCPTCAHSIMRYEWGKWHCATCYTSSKTAHIEALQDYALLISKRIKNDECAYHLNLSSSSQSYHLLRSLNLPSSGTNRSRHYHLESLLEKNK
ncbi:NERD domain-containing protein [Fictibacillus nanhaiensis]|uniref:nuclease-related domain-containing protein n=1 Tax=Fictibacillus nanhaiensis TaxID=742169 RepID=UPI001C9410D1|nr:nuclease-related domain-containing protein [Fictibacillus nanhaiensis]MBY6038394.1 NERD domain-containing protein [Fictibacillus nanhaiensis]